MRTHCAFAAALGALAFGTPGLSVTAASAQQHFCGGFGGSGSPVIQPVIYPELKFDRSNPGFDCQAWQAFIYLNWPALAGTRGAPNPNAKFGAPGTTVWETYKTLEQTFLAGARDPGPWNQAGMPGAGVPKNLAARVGTGQVRTLSRLSKISRIAVRNVVHAKVDNAILDSITQAGGGTLYDQGSVPVYYEIAMDEDQYNYIRQNALYDADKQLAFAQKTTIALPGGVTAYGKIGAIELKAAWKVLTAAERKSGRFHTAQAILAGRPNLEPVTVGLVGLHMFQMLGESSQGIWATFAQVDNAPVADAIGKGPYTFYNPACQPAPCPINNEQTNPTQVVQMSADDAGADGVNKNMRAMIQKYNPAAPWQHYKLVNVQWPQAPVALPSVQVPAMQPLPFGNPNTDTLTNAVLETFIQAKGTACLTCHISATVSPKQSSPSPTAPQNASSYSFMFGYAQAPAKP